MEENKKPIEKNCKNCKFWKDAHYLNNDENIKECSFATNSLRGNLAEAICYGKGISGELITRYDFGCVAFEPIDNN